MVVYVLCYTPEGQGTTLLSQSSPPALCGFWGLISYLHISAASVFTWWMNSLASKVLNAVSVFVMECVIYFLVISMLSKTSLQLLRSTDLHALVFWVAETTNIYHMWAFKIYFIVRNRGKRQKVIGLLLWCPTVTMYPCKIINISAIINEYILWAFTWFPQILYSHNNPKREILFSLSYTWRSLESIRNLLNVES